MVFVRTRRDASNPLDLLLEPRIMGPGTEKDVGLVKIVLGVG